MKKLIPIFLLLTFVLLFGFELSAEDNLELGSLEDSSNDLGQGKKFIFSLEDAIRMGLLNNKEVRAKDFDIEAAKWQLNQAKARGIPVFEYQLDLGPAPTRADDAIDSIFSGDVTLATRVRLNLGVPVYSFGKLNIAQNLAREGIRAEELRKLDKENEIVVKIKKLYSGILLAKDLLVVLKDAEKSLREEIERKEAANPPTDPIKLTKLKLLQFELLKKLWDAEKRSELAWEGLRITLGLSRNYEFNLKDQHLEPVKFQEKEFQEYLTQSRINYPQERLLNIGIRAKEGAYRLQKRSLAPDIGVGGFFEYGVTASDVSGVTATDDFNNPFNFTRAAFGVRIKGDLNIKSYRAKLKKAQAEYYSAAMKKSIAKEGLELDLRKDFLSLQQVKKEMRESERGLALARQLVFLTKSNLDVGVGDTDEYGDALKQFLIMKGRYLQSVFNFNSSVAELEAKVQNASEIYNMR